MHLTSSSKGYQQYNDNLHSQGIVLHSIANKVAIELLGLKYGVFSWFKEVLGCAD